jgi:two-component system chemotaxis response regulator CheB
VLVVDDSVVIRRLVSDVIAADPDLEVAGTAPNGRLALAKIEQLDPDLVVLDVEMPELDGLGVLAALRTSHPRLPVIMFSTLTERGAATTLDALLLGARDCVTKPANVGSVTAAIEAVRAELVPKVKALCARPTGPTTTATRPATATATAGAHRPVERAPAGVVDLVVIGVSTGGPNALHELVPRLPADLPVPVLVVQHMPPVFTRHLAERLDRSSALAVAEAAGGEPLRAGHVWVAPGGRHLAVRGVAGAARLALLDTPPESSCRPAADVLFRSAVDVHGAGVLGVVMTGMGHDGTRGAERIRAAGGRVVVQDQASSVVWGMPGSVVAGGYADAVVPLDRLAAEITRRVVGWRTAAATPSRPAAAGTGAQPAGAGARPSASR